MEENKDRGGLSLTLCIWLQETRAQAAMQENPKSYSFVVCSQDQPGVADSPLAVVGRAQIHLAGDNVKVGGCYGCWDFASISPFPLFPA